MIDKKGVVRHILQDVNPRVHVNEVLKILKGLDAPQHAIERGSVVTLAFELRNARGESLEDADARWPTCTAASAASSPRSRRAGGQGSRAELALTLEPEDAFGEYDAELLRVEPRDRFPETLEVGMQFEGVPGEAEEEAQIYTVTDITDDAVVVDGNHPWPASACGSSAGAGPRRDHGRAAQHGRSRRPRAPPTEPGVGVDSESTQHHLFRHDDRVQPRAEAERLGSSGSTVTLTQPMNGLPIRLQAHHAVDGLRACPRRAVRAGPWVSPCTKSIGARHAGRALDLSQ